MNTNTDNTLNSWRDDEEDFINPKDPLVRFIRERTEAKTLQGQPTELQKKYEEMGLEYDYQKREKTGSVYSNPEMARQKQEEELEALNPDFFQRVRESEKVVSVRDQLKQQFDEEMGRLNAVEVSIWSNPEYAASPYGKRDMQLLRQRQNQVSSYYQAEDAKLDGQFYSNLPPKDMEIANMLLADGVEGKRMTYYTTNHGNIRDTVNTLLMEVPPEKREDVTKRLLGDYVRDDQGNIVRNKAGEELRSGGELVELTGFGTYDYKVSPKAYENGYNKIVEEYSKETEDFASRVRELQTQKSILEEAAATAGDKEKDFYNQELSNIDKELASTVFKARGVDTKATEVAPTTPTETATEGEAKAEEIAPEIKSMEEDINNTKSMLLEDNRVKENSDGTLSYTDDADDELKNFVNELNKNYQDLVIKKSGRSALLEGTGLASVGRGIKSAASTVANVVSAPTMYQYSLIGDFLSERMGEARDVLSGFEEAGRQKILSEEKVRTKGVF